MRRPARRGTVNNRPMVRHHVDGRRTFAVTSGAICSTHLCNSRLREAATTHLVPSRQPRSEEEDCDDYENNCEDDPSEDLPGLGGGVTAFASEFVCSASTMRDVDALKVLRTAQSVVTLAPRGRWRRTIVTRWPRRCSCRRTIRMTALWARFSLGRDLTTARGARNQRHGALQLLRPLHGPVDKPQGGSGQVQPLVWRLLSVSCRWWTRRGASMACGACSRARNWA